MASPSNQAEDIRSVAAARNGHPGAFDDIMRRYQDRVFNTIFRLIGDYQEAKDLTQKTFLKAYLSIDRFRGNSSFYTWLYRIGVNTTLDERKKRSRSPVFGVDSLEQSVAEMPNRAQVSSRAEDPVENVLVTEREQAVTKAIESLDEVHRSVVVLRDIEGMDYDEIAEVMDCPRGTVKSRLHRARSVLREKLKDLMK